MKQKIKDFLFKRRFKPLKNKKGFSLLEVLIAVGIIGIISAIAYPSFEEYRGNAAKVASDTSASNVVKAFRNCVVLNGFSNCDTRAKLKMNCPSDSNCTEGKDASAGKLCVGISRGTGGNDFKVCVSMDTGGGESRTYGGNLLTDKLCHQTGADVSSGSGCTNTAEAPYNVGTSCNLQTDCTAKADDSKCTYTVSACKVPVTAGVCNSNGTCS